MILVGPLALRAQGVEGNSQPKIWKEAQLQLTCVFSKLSFPHHCLEMDGHSLTKKEVAKIAGSLAPHLAAMGLPPDLLRYALMLFYLANP